MTLSRRSIRAFNSPIRSPKRANSTFNKKRLLKRLSTDVQFGAASKANLKVVVRVRPQNERERQLNNRIAVEVIDEHMLIFDPKDIDEGFFFHGAKQHVRDLNKKQNKEQKFVFENVFSPDSTNTEIFETATKEIVDSVLDGYNCSGAGKTYTMLGTSEYPGITFLTVMELYKKIEEIKAEKNCEVAVSYLEIYNETVKDLLYAGKSLNLQELGQQVHVPGLSIHKPKDEHTLMELLAFGNKNRSQHPTDANAESSRSHAVFQVFVKQQEKTCLKSNVTIAKLSMIDLAGSERGAATGFIGARFREGANINRSLLALGNCINALAGGLKHIPYRDSKLTRLLKDSLGGNCKSVMIAAVSPSYGSFEDTLNTLRYATRAKTIKTTLKKNLMNVDQHVSQYVKVVEDLRDEVTSLREKLSKQQKQMDALIAEDENKGAQIFKLQEELDQCKHNSGTQNLHSDKADVIEKIHDLQQEIKSYRRELLQIESFERELEYKLFNNRCSLARIRAVRFAAFKLDKSRLKCEKSIMMITNQLESAKTRKQHVESKLEEAIMCVDDLYSSFEIENHGESSYPNYIKNLMEMNANELVVRDSHLLSSYLSDMLRECLIEQENSQQLILSTLWSFSQYYLHLRASNDASQSVEEIFQNVVKLLGGNSVMFADQSRLPESMDYTPPPSLNLKRIVNLPVSSYHFSPCTVINDIQYKQSIMKKKINVNNYCTPETEPNSCYKTVAQYAPVYKEEIVAHIASNTIDNIESNILPTSVACSSDMTTSTSSQRVSVPENSGNINGNLLTVGNCNCLSSCVISHSNEMSSYSENQHYAYTNANLCSKQQLSISNATSAYKTNSNIPVVSPEPLTGSYVSSTCYSSQDFLVISEVESTTVEFPEVSNTSKDINSTFSMTNIALDTHVPPSKKCSAPSNILCLANKALDSKPSGPPDAKSILKKTKSFLKAAQTPLVKCKITPGKSSSTLKRCTSVPSLTKESKIMASGCSTVKKPGCGSTLKRTQSYKSLNSKCDQENIPPGFLKKTNRQLFVGDLSHKNVLNSTVTYNT